MAQASYVTETQVVNQIASDPNVRIIWTNHALRQMSERGIWEADVENVLMNGHVTLIETNKKDILWRIVGKDVDGRRLTVVAAVYDVSIAIKVVTTF